MSGVVLCLPIADRAVSHTFFRALDLPVVGEPGAEVVTPAGAQPWGYAGVFADPDGHLWQVTSTPAPG